MAGFHLLSFGIPVPRSDGVASCCLGQTGTIDDESGWLVHVRRKTAGAPYRSQEVPAFSPHRFSQKTYIIGRQDTIIVAVG